MIPLALSLDGRVAQVVAFAYNPAQKRVPKGAEDGGKWTDDETSSLNRALRAINNHKPSTAAKQRLAEAQERTIVRALGAKQSEDNDPVDVYGVARSGRKYGVEVKTLVDNKNDKITMHPESLARKERWARKEKAVLHTVVIDVRTADRAVYYRKDVE